MLGGPITGSGPSGSGMKSTAGLYVKLPPGFSIPPVIGVPVTRSTCGVCVSGPPASGSGPGVHVGIFRLDQGYEGNILDQELLGRDKMVSEALSNAMNKEE